MDLFESAAEESPSRPLAIRMSPRTLEEYVGQEHLLGPGKLLRRLLESNRIVSLILYGPPGTGKTAFARLIARRTKSRFTALNAVTSGLADLRKVFDEAAEAKKLYQQTTILFLDEIHHFNKSQQDALLPHLEQGAILLVGATTQNPFFALNTALLSRSRVCELRPLDGKNLSVILDRALADPQRGLGKHKVDLAPDARAHLLKAASGDARTLLNALEVGVLTTPPDGEGVIRFTLDVAQESIQKRMVQYDAAGDQHYDTISAFIKSIRGSDPDAALYWLAKMIYAGEDPRFIARRLVISAAEDVGNADPQGITVAVAAQQALEFIGLPEGRIPLAQATVYLACAPKSNAAYMGLEKAIEDVQKETTKEVPTHLRDAHYPGAKVLGHGQGYQYAHDHPGHYVKQEYVTQPRNYYIPTTLGYEAKIKAWLEHLEELGASQPPKGPSP
ncbi:MAG TPA: replication-associated recombination protein A [bacterium]|nr:replication-associated recombination protein A [bacterium]